MTHSMNIREIKNIHTADEQGKRKLQKGNKNFYDSFSKSMDFQKGEELEDTVNTEINKVNTEINKVSTDKDTLYTDAAGHLSEHQIKPIQLAAAVNVPLRHICYAESDKINISVIHGYTLKAKRDIQGEGNSVYVEAKYEDGRCEGYLIDTKKVSENTENAIEKIANEVIQKKEEF